MTKSHVVKELADGGYSLPVYEYRCPEAVRTGTVQRVPVVVVGGGLTGLACATDLASRGVSCVLLDEDDTVGVRGASSRGIAYATKTLEILGRIGAVEQVMAKGVTWKIGRVMDLHGELYSFDLSLENRSVYPPFVNLQQFYVEAAMVDRAYELGMDLRWKNRVTRAQFHADHAVLFVDTPDGGYKIEAEWVVDATGVNSPLRAFAKIPVDTKFSEDQFCICDVRPKEPQPFERRTWLRAPFNEARSVWSLPMADSVWRLDYHLPPDCDLSTIDDAYVTQLVKQHYGEKADVEIVWYGPWAYRNQLAETFRQGRVFLIGDAAHAFSPAGGRGGNSGIQDAENLAWKLALVVRGEATEALLDTYDRERRAAAQENIAFTSESMRFIAPRTKEDFERRDKALDDARIDPSAFKKVNTGRLSDPTVYKVSDAVLAGGQSLADRALRRADGSSVRMCELTGGPTAGVVLDFSNDAAASAKLAEQVAALGHGVRYQRICDAPSGKAAASDADLRDEIGIPGTADTAVFVRADSHVAAIAGHDAIIASVKKALCL